MIVIGVIFLVLALVLLVIGGMATARKLPGNSVVGIRVAEVRKSKEIWDAAHHLAGPFWIIGGVALVFGGMIAFRADGWGWLIPAFAVIVALIFIGIGANVGARTAASIDVKDEYDKANPTPAPKPKPDLNALRRAADAEDTRGEK